MARLAPVAGCRCMTTSQSYVASLSKLPVLVKSAGETRKEVLKREIRMRVAAGRMDELLQLLVRWTQPKATVQWLEVLLQADLAHVLHKLVKYQVGLLAGAASAELVLRSRSRGKFHLADAARAHIRTVYSQLIFGRSGSHIYAKTHRHKWEPETYALTAQDYENLITLEVNSGKFDLALLWFRRMEQQFPNTHFQTMTHSLWRLKLEVFGRAFPAYWKVPALGLYLPSLGPRRGLIVSARLWVDIFNEYVQNKPLGALFDNNMAIAMLFSVGHSGNMDQFLRLLETYWGICANGQKVEGFMLDRDSPLYPTVDVVRAAAVSLIFNRQFLNAMAVINAFQEHFSVDLAGASYFWDQVVLWAERTTRYSDDQALKYFLRKTEVNLGDVTLAEAQTSPDFDYEGYLTFIAELRQQRSSLIRELWKCFHECNTTFLPRVYKTYLTLLLEEQNEEECFEYLRELLSQRDAYAVSPHSFNQSVGAKTNAKISVIYSACLRHIVELKGVAGALGQIEPLIEKWSLNTAMEAKLKEFAAAEQPRYLRMRNERETKKQEEEEDEFLGIM